MKNATKLKLPCGDFAFFPSEIKEKAKQDNHLIFFVISYINHKGYLVGLEKSGPLFILERDITSSEEALKLVNEYTKPAWEETEVKHRFGSFSYKTAPSPYIYQRFVDESMKEESR